MKIQNIDQYDKCDWWFFDTNCLSELVKVFDHGKELEISLLLRDKDVFIPPTVLAELRKCPNLLQALPRVLESTRLTCFSTQVFPFIRREFFLLLGLKVIDPNPLGLELLTSEGIEYFLVNPDIDRTLASSEKEVNERYSAQVQPDIGAGINEFDIYIYASSVTHDHLKATLRVAEDIIPKKMEVSPRTFPSSFGFWYSYYFLYLKSNTSKPNSNDLYDLSHTAAAPICTRFYTERRLAYTMKEVQKLYLPSERAVANYLKRKVPNANISEETVSQSNPERYKLMQATEIFTLTELRRHLGA